jgi:hypothetical protein
VKVYSNNTIDGFQLKRTAEIQKALRHCHSLAQMGAGNIAA